MPGPLVIVDSDLKGKVFLGYFDHNAEIAVVLSPPFRCSYNESADEQEQSHLHFTFTPLPSHSKFLELLDKDHEREILIAFENDLPGSYLGWLVYGYLASQKRNQKIQRLCVPYLSKEGIGKAIERASLEELEERQEFFIRSLFDAGLAAHLQRLLGSPVGPGNRPLTYASLTTLFLLVDRETEIRMHPSRTNWQILVKLGEGSKTFDAHLEKIPGVTKNGLINDVALGKELVVRFQNTTFVVDKIERSESVYKAPSPYVLQELIHEARTLYGFSPGNSLAILKNLWNGIEIEGSCEALISSPLSSEEAYVDLAAVLQKTAVLKYGNENSRPARPEWVPGVILVINPDRDLHGLKNVLDDESLKMYTLILDRSLACFLGDAMVESTKVRLSSADAVFCGHFHAVSRQGFLAAKSAYGPQLMEPCPVADLHEGQLFTSLSVFPQQAPHDFAKHYTCETLFADLADFSVKAAPYNFTMLQGLIEHDYVSLSGDGELVCGPNSGRVTMLVNKAFPKMSGINLSAYIEQTVNEVLSGRKGLDFALKQFSQTLMIQGKTLVQVKLPQQIALNRRSSSTVIKQAPVEPRREALPADSSKNIGAEEKGKPLDDVPIQDQSVDMGGASLEIEDIVGQSSGDLNIDLQTAEPSVDAVEEEVQVSVFAEEIDEGRGRNGDVTDEYGQDASAFEGVDTDAGVSPEEKEEGEGDGEGEGEDRFEEVKEQLVVLDSLDMAEGDSRVKGDSRAERSVQSEGEAVETDLVKDCQVCGKVMILKKDKFGKFWSCSGFPACRHSESYKAGQEEVQRCPLCKENDIVIRKTPTGKTFYVCLGGECEFMAWSKPHSIACQVCDSPYLVEKKSANGENTNLRCPKAGCHFIQAMPGEGATDLPDERLKEAEEPALKKVRVVRRAPVATSSSGGTKKVRVVRRRK